MLSPYKKRRTEERRKQAAERQTARNKRSDKQQLTLLDSRLGRGVGAKRERQRIAERMIAVSNKNK